MERINMNSFERGMTSRFGLIDVQSILVEVKVTNNGFYFNDFFVL